MSRFINELGVVCLPNVKSSCTSKVVSKKNKKIKKKMKEKKMKMVRKGLNNYCRLAAEEVLVDASRQVVANFVSSLLRGY